MSVYIVWAMKTCGTRAKYNGGCRCEQCRAAWATYMRQRRAPGARANAIARALDSLEREIATADDVALTVDTKLSPLAARILTRVAHKTQRLPSEVVDELLRMYGPVMLSVEV